MPHRIYSKRYIATLMVAALTGATGIAPTLGKTVFADTTTTTTSSTSVAATGTITVSAVTATNDPMPGDVNITLNGTTLANGFTGGTGTCTLSVPNIQSSETVTVAFNSPAGHLAKAVTLDPSVSSSLSQSVQFQCNVVKVSGTVTQNGAGVANAPLQAGNTGTQTASDGSYAVYLAPGSTTTVTATSGYYYGSTTVTVPTAPSDITNEDISLDTEGGIIQGTVQDSSGVLQYASVTATDADGNQFFGSSDNTGAFSLLVPAGTYSVKANSNGETVTQTGVVVTAGQSLAQPLSLTATPAGIVGTVLDETGNPIDGVAISVKGPYGGMWFDTSHNGGKFNISTVPDGTYTVTAASGLDNVSAQVTVSGGVSSPCTLQLAPYSGTGLVGTVKDAAGVVDGATVSVNDTQGNLISQTTTDANGQYVLPADPGTYLVQVTKGTEVSYIPGVTVGTGGPTNNDVTIQQGGTISGTVTDTKTGKPLQAYVTVYLNGQMIAGTGTDSTTGDYSILVPPGSYTLKADTGSESQGSGSGVSGSSGSAGGSATIGYSITPTPIQVVAGNTPTPCDFSMIANGLFGTVTGEEPNQPAEVSLISDHGDWGTNAVDGNYISLVPAGSYTVIAASGDNVSIQKNVTVGTDGLTENDLMLQQGSHVSGAVTAYGGSAPAAGMEIRVLDSDGAVVGDLMNRSGTFTFALPVGDNYQIMAGYQGDTLYPIGDKFSITAGTPVSISGALPSTANPDAPLLNNLFFQLRNEQDSVHTSLETSGGMPALSNVVDGITSGSHDWTKLIYGTENPSDPDGHNKALAAARLIQFLYQMPTLAPGDAVETNIYDVTQDFQAVNPAITNVDVLNFYQNLQTKLLADLADGTTQQSWSGMLSDAIQSAEQNTTDPDTGAHIFNGTLDALTPTAVDAMIQAVDSDTSGTKALVLALGMSNFSLPSDAPTLVSPTHDPVDYALTTQGQGGVAVTATGVQWQSSDPTVASFGDTPGELDIHSKGTTVVTAAVNGFVIQKFSVTVADVEPVTVKSIQVDGVAAPSALGATVSLINGQLSVQLKDGQDYDLTRAGVTTDDTVTVKVDVPSTYVPMVLTSAGDVTGSWTEEADPSNPGQSIITLTGKPLSTSWTMQAPPADPNDPSWPPQNADADYAAMLLFDMTDASTLPDGGDSDAASTLQGVYVGTNAQEFTTPYFDGTGKHLTFTVAAPHYKSDGTTVQTGWFEAYIPDSALLAMWGIGHPSTLVPGSFVASLTESGSNNKKVFPTIQQVDGGVLLTYTGFNYSTENVSIYPSSEDTTPTLPTVPQQPTEPTEPTAPTAPTTPGQGSGDGGEGGSEKAPTPPKSTGKAFTTVVATKTVDTSGGTITATTGKTHVQVQVASGAFDKPEDITVTSGNASDATKVFQQTPAYTGYKPATTFGINFTGSTPSAPITVTVQDPSIPANAQVFKVNADGTLVPVKATVSKGQVTITFTSDPNFIVATPKTTKGILVNGKDAAEVQSIVHGGTTYMPVWYVMHALQSLGFTSKWDGGHWYLTTPAGAKPDLSKIQVGSGGMSIYLDGTLVHKVNGMFAKDPASGNPTTYMPVWYVMQILQRAGMHSTWDGTNWTLTTQTN